MLRCAVRARVPACSGLRLQSTLSVRQFTKLQFHPASFVRTRPVRPLGSVFRAFSLSKKESDVDVRNTVPIAVQEFAGEHKSVSYYQQKGAQSAPLVPVIARAQDSLPLLQQPNLVFQKLLAYFLPKDYPDSVSSNYTPYIKWQFCQSVLSACGGVLSTQSLLFAIGLGASTALPAAAALNWVIKDGLGQLGGVILASLVSNKFDADPKRWRMVSSYALNAATCVEILTPLVPSLFLPLASFANIGKNITWLAGSATKASIHKSFIQAENLADLTAKSGSQGIAASLLGTALGVGLSAVIGASTSVVLTAFALIASAHLYCNYRSLLVVALPTLNVQRCERLMFHYVRHFPPTDFADNAAVIASSTAAAYIPDPHDIKELETFMRTYQSPFFHSVVNVSCNLDAVAGSMEDLTQLRSQFHQEQYLLRYIPRSGPGAKATVNLLFLESAGSDDLIRGFLHVSKLRELIEKDSVSSAHPSEPTTLVAQSLSWTRLHFPGFIAAVQDRGWVTSNVFLEPERRRVRFADQPEKEEPTAPITPAS